MVNKTMIFTSAEKDRLFGGTRSVSDFKFDDSVSRVFDDMVTRSVPFYHEVQRMIGEIASFYFQPGTSIFDLGCSTGKTLFSLMRAIDDPTATFVGIDNAQPMLQKARFNLKRVKKKRKLQLIKANLDSKDFKLSNASVITMNWTLQFVRPLYREQILRKIRQGLVKKGVFVIFEKIAVNQSELNRVYTELYYAFKKRNGYSDLEISRKREALENVLMPYTIDENIETMKKAGFRNIDVFFRWYNWSGFIALV